MSQPSTSIHEMSFSYELFVKLYCDRVQLQPFGLVNLGNSCYADAFLQCLALTRLLISYLIRGLHSKTCEEATVSVPQSKDKNIRDRCSITNTINPDRRKSHEGSAPLLQQREGSQKPALMMDLLELRTKNLTVKMKLFDAHCHLQDKRVIDEASQLISAAFSCRCYQFRSQWNLRERLGLGERDGRDVSFCCTLHRTTSLMKSLASAASAELLKSTIAIGVVAAALAFFMDVAQLSEMVSVGTLMAFTVVAACVLVLRYVPTDGVPLSSHWFSRFN
ncbi:Papain-like cysteine peptidase superfamily [Arabidopsis suecica]|uniref:Papain-like cysteine peptidase superfamily n=1 Tax=Arabidopsis suecica TaxID=45249 RepID=A0A8T2B377_ARASU|nr:Papain-like cysteine peptidase superfamily [Arabidopsis suecica]